MRLEGFQQSDQEPIGEGNSKEVFINPTNKDRVISVIKEKEAKDKESANKLKGAFYLTKIVHLLIPENIPDIYQAGESVEGQGSFDRKFIENPIDSKDRNDNKKISEIDMRLSKIGLGFNIDENYGNYKKDEKGNINYLEEFMPWEVDVVEHDKLELLFDEAELKKAIERVPDPAIKKLCEAYFERLMILYKEESVIQKEKFDALNEIDHSAEVKAVEELFELFEKKYNVEALYAIKTEANAIKSEERNSAKNDLIPIRNLIKKLNMNNESLEERYKILSRAIGIINSGLVDHNRG